jgi:hypothetical protein
MSHALMQASPTGDISVVHLLLPMYAAFGRNLMVSPFGASCSFTNAVDKEWGHLCSADLDESKGHMLENLAGSCLVNGKAVLLTSYSCMMQQHCCQQ